MRSTYLIPVLLLIFVVGCHQPKNQKNEAELQWNAARAGVLYGLAKDQYAAGSFDVVLSTYGAMFTPDHKRCARS